jgi:hypothetical protein
MPQATIDETVAQYAARVGLIAGDIYTFVVLAEREEIAYQSPRYDDALASLNYCNFGWVRCIVKSGLSDVSDTMTEYSQIFDFQSSGGDFDTSLSDLHSKAPDDVIDLSALLVNGGEGYTLTGAIGLIRSRLDMDLRSDSVMHVKYGTQADDLYGIASDYILDEWSSGTTSVGDSNLILEGGDV